MYKEYFKELEKCLEELDIGELNKIEEKIIETIKNKGNIYVIGNGGSASTSAHYVVDFSKKLDFNTLPRVNIYSLSDNISTITAYANDISYENIFYEQIKNKISSLDLLIILSASGKSPNVVKAGKYAKKMNANVISITGNFNGEILKCSDFKLIINSKNYGVIEDIHLILNHAITDSIKEKYSNV